jgi:hypothetical protein
MFKAVDGILRAGALDLEKVGFVHGLTWSTPHMPSNKPLSHSWSTYRKARHDEMYALKPETSTSAAQQRMVFPSWSWLSSKQRVVFINPYGFEPFRVT